MEVLFSGLVVCSIVYFTINEIFMTLPKAEDVLEEVTTKDNPHYVSRNLTNERLVEAMKEYARQVLDYVSQNAEIECDESGLAEYCHVDKQSILKIKNELL